MSDTYQVVEFIPVQLVGTGMDLSIV